ncbi:MAG TPA: hypothetical protein VFV75_02595 [Candidatus Polarisedimenticolaceae bacterium]|nr:hypothetical protein [Candidatus Polarisedimenticolaceae bacterium]
MRGLRARFLVVLLCLSGAGTAGTAAPSTGVLGTWAGRSLCVGDRPACKDEEVVYRFLPVEGRAGTVTLLADKVLEGKRVPMGRLDFDQDTARGTLRCEFTRGSTHGVWTFRVSGDAMTGTLVILPERSVAREVSVRRVREDAVPAAPAVQDYA